MNQVTIVSGVSGSGKSTFVRSIRGAAVFSADDYFYDAKGQYNFDPSKLGEAHGVTFRLFVEALQAKIPNVVVDNTNTTTMEISPYVLASQAFGYDCRIVTVMVPEDRLHVAAARNRHGVPIEGVRSQFDRIQSRELPPWWKHETILSSI